MFYLTQCVCSPAVVHALVDVVPTARPSRDAYDSPTYVTGHASRVTGHRSQGTGHGSQITDHRSWATGHGSQVTGHVSQVTGHMVTGHGSSDTGQSQSEFYLLTYCRTTVSLKVKDMRPLELCHKVHHC